MIEQLGNFFLAFQLAQQLFHPIEICRRRFIEQVRLAAHDHYRARGIVTGPSRQAAGDQVLRRCIERGFSLTNLFRQPGPCFFQGQARQALADIIGGFRQGRRRNGMRQIDDPVFDRSVITDQHGQRLAIGQRHETELIEHRLSLGDMDDACACRQAGQGGGGVGDRLFDRPFPINLRGDGLLLCGCQSTRLHHAIDKQPETGFGRHPPRTGMGCSQQLQLLQILHDIAD